MAGAVPLEQSMAIQITQLPRTQESKTAPFQGCGREDFFGCNALHVCYKDNGREGVKVFDAFCVCKTLIPICLDRVWLQRLNKDLK